MVTRLYLDKRAQKADGTFPVKLSLAHHGKTALISLDVFLEASAWDSARQAVVRVPNKAVLNNYLQRRKIEIDDALRDLGVAGKLVGLTITQVREAVLAYLDPVEARPVLFVEHFRDYTARRNTPRSRENYEQTLRRIMDYDPKAEALRFEDITRAWLDNFRAWLSARGLSINSQALFLTHIRASFNDALDNELTAWYPFRKYKIKHETTAKRSLPVETLREVFQAGTPARRKYFQVFALSFMLIGINLVDLAKARRANIQDGRLVFNRSKTRRFYSIKIEPEAQALLDMFTEGDVLLGLQKTCADYRGFNYAINRALREFRPGLSMYWARHSWATIASALHVDKETIAKALGHGGRSVTDIYIDFDLERVDRANRLVLDYVLYNKTPDGQTLP